MTQHTLALTRTQKLMLIFCLFTSHGLCAAEKAETDVQQPLTYNQVATAELLALYEGTDDLNYKEHRLSFHQLVDKNNANPNVTKHGTSLLSRAVMHNDLETTRLLLARGANTNPPEDQPLTWAQTAEMAQLLVDNQADLTFRDSTFHGNLLHNAMLHNRSTEVVTFLCNARVDPNLQTRWGDSPLHYGFKPGFIQKTVPLLWLQANLNSRNDRNQTPLNVLRKESPDLVPQAQALITVVPEVRREKRQEYQQTRSLLTQQITVNLAAIVIGYTGQLPGILYDESFLPDIEHRVAQRIEASKKSRKRLHSITPVRAKKK